MTDEMKKYDDVSSDNELRQYPNLRAIILRKLERKKKNENLEATRQVLGGRHGKATGAVQSDVYDEELDKEQNGLAAGGPKRPGSSARTPGTLADGTAKRKDQACYRFIRGLCKKSGKECPYSHDAKQCDPVRAEVLAKYNPNKLSAAPVQRRLRKTTTHPAGSKKQSLRVCRFFAQGKCNKGTKCQFSHDERYKAAAKSQLEARKSTGRGRSRGGRGRRGRSRGRGARGAGAVDAEPAEQADGEDNEEEEVDFVEVDVEAPSEEQPNTQ